MLEYEKPHDHLPLDGALHGDAATWRASPSSCRAAGLARSRFSVPLSDSDDDSTVADDVTSRRLPTPAPSPHPSALPRSSKPSASSTQRPPPTRPPRTASTSAAESHPNRSPQPGLSATLRPTLAPGLAQPLSRAAPHLNGSIDDVDASAQVNRRLFTERKPAPDDRDDARRGGEPLASRASHAVNRAGRARLVTPAPRRAPPSAPAQSAGEATSAMRGGGGRRAGATFGLPPEEAAGGDADDVPPDARATSAGAAGVDTRATRERVLSGAAAAVWSRHTPDLSADAKQRLADAALLQRHAAAAVAGSSATLQAVDDAMRLNEVGSDAHARFCASLAAGLEDEQALLNRLRREEERRVADMLSKLFTKSKASVEQFREAELARQRAEEARAKREAEKAAAERAAAAKAAAAAQAAAAEAKSKADADAQQAAAAAAQAAEQEKRRREAETAAAGALASTSATSTAAATGDPLVKATASALAESARLAQGMAAAADDAAYKQYTTDNACKAGRRAIEKEINTRVQQITATQVQIRVKSQELVALLNNAPEGPPRTHAYLTLAKKLVLQCEVQVTRLQSFAFAMAALLASVATVHPRVMEYTIAQLQAKCPFTRPQYTIFSHGKLTQEEWNRRNGYREVEEGANGKRWETKDELVDRNNGYMMFYGALLQSTPSGIQAAWTFVARFLNALPANRLTATALLGFIKNAGFMLHRQYRHQFIKLLRVADEEFLRDLDGEQDPDSSAVRTRLHMYLEYKQYLKEPEGRELQPEDESSYCRA